MNIEAKTVVVVDYGMGNLRSVSQAVRAVAANTGWHVLVTSRPEEVRAAERVVLPGQGAMPDCMRELRESGLQEAVLDAAAHKPLMGVCVGMQVMFEGSAEPSESPVDGVGEWPGTVTRLLAPAGATPAACRQTRLTELVNDLDPKLAAVALGMNNNGLVRYAADNVARTASLTAPCEALNHACATASGVSRN